MYRTIGDEVVNGITYKRLDGYHYISHNSTGEIYRIDVSTREARFVLSSIDGLRFNDGFSCQFRPILI